MSKEKKIVFRVSHTEFVLIREKADKSNSPNVSDYLRNIALDYQPTYKLTHEEIRVYLLLNETRESLRRINKLFEEGSNSGAEKLTIETCKLIQQHLNKLK